jgi:hypothetical protein
MVRVTSDGNRSPEQWDGRGTIRSVEDLLAANPALLAIADTDGQQGGFKPVGAPELRH